MADSFERLYRAYGQVLIWLGTLAGIIAFVVMWLIDVNAVTRKLFNAPVPGSFELTEAALVLIVFLGLAYTQQRRGHIRVTLLTRRMPLGLRHFLFILAMLVGAALTAWYAYAAYTFALRSFKLNEQQWGVIVFPVWPVKASIAVGMALLSLQFLLDAIRHCLVAAGRLAPVGDEP
jgi:TRAP-type transport system small permease protein